jgi:predicted transposase/invertase (TIGR01784 family)
MGVNAKYKDSVFSFLFSEPETLRELYSALEGIPLDPDAAIEINTLSSVLFMEQINDISFTVDNRLVILLEHQSTINPNMPLRLLMYIARVYEKITDSKNIYGSKKVPIPRPEFIVLYNGVKPYPDTKVLKLSDSFEEVKQLGIDASALSELELTVKVYNINMGRNAEMVKRSEKLNGYTTFIAKTREFRRDNSQEEAVKTAIAWCIEHDILKNFLELHSSEVMNMLLTEWKLEDALAVRGEEGRQEGRQESKLEIARNALAKGFSPDVISTITGLDIAVIKTLPAQ